MNKKIHPQYALLKTLQGLKGVRKAVNHTSKPGVILINLTPSWGNLGGVEVKPIFEVTHKERHATLYNIPDLQRVARQIRDEWEALGWGKSLKIDEPAILTDDNNKRLAGYASDMLILYVEED